MKSKMLFMCIVIGSLCMTVGTLSYGATINHDEGSPGKAYALYVADLGGSVDAYVFALSASATLEAEILITPVYPYAGEVKKYALKTSVRKTSLFRLARDGLS